MTTNAAEINAQHDARIAGIARTMADWAIRYDLYTIDAQRHTALADLDVAEGRDDSLNRKFAREANTMARNIARRQERADARRAA